MEIREGLLYAKSHEWVKEEGDVVTIGLTAVSYTHLSGVRIPARSCRQARTLKVLVFFCTFI